MSRSKASLFSALTLGCLLWIALYVSSTSLAGQTTDAIVSGTVSDPSGAAVVGATVTARNVDTGVVTTTMTNSSGVYTLPPLPYGKYDFKTSHPGFREIVTAGVTLTAAAQLTLNSTLQIGATTETVEVQATAAGLTLSTATVASSVDNLRIQDLPIAGRDAQSFLYLQAGLGSTGAGFNGTRTGTTNVTVDGISTLSNRIDGINTTGVVTSSGLLGTTSFQSATRVDRVEEVNVVTSPVDVEFNRGLGQLQLVTRSGTNQFHGSAFEELRNNDLNANNWFSNAAGHNSITGAMLQPRPVLISNQYGGRVGGPIRKNKTFFNAYYEGQRQIAKNNVIDTVLTAQARQGIFRYFPGVQNGNAASAKPTVDVNGNPIQPAGATGPLTSTSIFGLDPNRLIADPSGVIQKALSLTPLPNYFLVGDGLNTAGYTFQEKVPTHFDTYEGRVDHNFTDNERLQVSFNHISFSQPQYSTLTPPVPSTPAGLAIDTTSMVTVVLNSILRPNLLNAVRIGIDRPSINVIAPWDPSLGGTSILYQQGNQPYRIQPLTFTPPIPANDGAIDGYKNITPNYQYGDTLTWLKGKHSFKGGIEARLISYAGNDVAFVTPTAFIGPGATPVQGLTSTNFPALGTNLTNAQNLLLDLAGSLGSPTSGAVSQTLNAPSQSSSFLPGLSRYAWLKQHEWSMFFKDEIKVSPSFTLNLGVRYELYQVPFEAHGDAVIPEGGGYSLFGISGNSWGSEFHPGVLNGSLITPIQVGPGGPNPSVPLFKGDHNNFGPGVGFAYSLPWFGKDKTVLRMGYGIVYERTPIYVTQLPTIYAPGLGQSFANFPTRYENLANIQVPVTPTNTPMQQIPLNSNPYASRQLTFSTFDPNLRTPYIQNWNIAIQRRLPWNSTLEVRYVGTKGTKLIRGTNVNETNVVENGIANAFNIVKSGGDSPLIDQIFSRYAAAGSTGSQYVLTSPFTQSFFANNNVGGFANFINNSQSLTAGVPGGLLLNAGLPENFITASPQYATEYLISNLGASTYHALQIEFRKTYSQGLVLQSNFTWNRYLGDYNAGDDSALETSFRTLRNEGLDKQLLDRKFFWRTNGLWELPFGPGKRFGRNTHGIVAKAIDGWQAGVIFNVFSGYPITLYENNSTFNTVSADSLSNISGPIPSGSITKVGSGVQFFPNLIQIADPQVASLSPAVRALSQLRAITNSAGQIIFSNSLPGQIGNLAPGALLGPGYFQFDMNLLKIVRFRENMQLQIGANALNVLNTPQFANPVATLGYATIDSTSFGKLTTTAYTNRIVVLTGRFTF